MMKSLFDMRTVFDEEIPLLAAGIEKALAKSKVAKLCRTSTFVTPYSMQNDY